MGLYRRNILTNELVQDSLTSSRTQLPNARQHMHSGNLNGTQTAHTVKPRVGHVGAYLQVRNRASEKRLSGISTNCRFVSEQV